jgi:monofunctional biosynthetic peptidoglycan transglycosylase
MAEPLINPLPLPQGLSTGTPAPVALPRESNRRRTLRLALLAALGLSLVYLAWEALTWPDVSALATRRPVTTAFIEHYKHGWLGLGAERRVEWKWVPYSRISSNLKMAVLCGEDLRFFAHSGFDEEEMKAALQDAWDEKELPRGASTITQQLAKNLWLSPSYNPLRKVKEALLTRQLEKNLAKKRILHIYLNVVEFGPGIYGAEAAARHYFHKSAAGLSDQEAAQLAASLPAPKTWHPGGTTRGYRAHVRTVARRMARAAGWLRREV